MNWQEPGSCLLIEVIRSLVVLNSGDAKNKFFSSLDIEKAVLGSGIRKIAFNPNRLGHRSPVCRYFPTTISVGFYGAPCEIDVPLVFNGNFLDDTDLAVIEQTKFHDGSKTKFATAIGHRSLNVSPALKFGASCNYGILYGFPVQANPTAHWRKQDYFH